MTTAIEWTDETWNPVVGCTKVSQGCKHCYAKTLHDKRHKAALAGKAVHPQYLQPFETVQLMPERLEQPLHWRKPRRCFVNSVSDLFHEDVPDRFIESVFGVMAAAPRHTFQILTKRPGRMLSWFTTMAGLEERRVAVASEAERLGRIVFDSRGSEPAHYIGSFSLEDVANRVSWPGWPLPNVWLGVSVEDQEAADERIPLLLQTPAAIRFLSCEPLLGPLDLWLWLEEDERQIDWVIVGGESGPGARQCDLGWIETIVADCDLNGVACFVKQLGAQPVCRNDWPADEWPGSSTPFAEQYVPHHQGEIAPLTLRHRKGGDLMEWPLSLCVRDFPAPRVPA